MDRSPPRPQDGTTGRRASSRLRLHLPATLTLLSGDRRVVLVNLSEDGAQVDLGRGGAQGFRVGSNAVLNWHRYETFCEVRWIADDHAGLMFEEHIPQEAVLATRTFQDQSRQPSEREIGRDFARRWAQGRS